MILQIYSISTPTAVLDENGEAKVIWSEINQVKDLENKVQERIAEIHKQYKIQYG